MTWNRGRHVVEFRRARLGAKQAIVFVSAPCLMFLLDLADLVDAQRGRLNRAVAGKGSRSVGTADPHSSDTRSLIE